MIETILLTALALSMVFFFYEFNKIRYLYFKKENIENVLPRFSDIGKIKEETKESKIEVELREIEDTISKIEKKIEKQEDVISKLIEKLSEK